MEQCRMYFKFSDYLKEKYGSKVYKLPVNLPVTCPNRDGLYGSGGCIFCGEEGAGFECLSSQIPVKKQLQDNAVYIGKNYGSDKFIAYFQNYSNTYLALDKFKAFIEEALLENIVAIYISTRPDCINDKYLEFLENIKKRKGVDIVIELGLQTVNYHTLKVLERGHSLAEFVDAAIRIRTFNLECCAHYIVDLPMDNIEDTIEGAKIISALGISQVKCHSLIILEGTKLGELYKNGEVTPITLDEYIDRIISFLEYLNPQIVVQRLLGRAPEERTLFCNWNTSWWKIRDLIEQKMIENNTYQGKKFNYLNGQKCMVGCSFR